MRIYIIDQQPIYLLGLTQFLKSLFSSDSEVFSNNSIASINYEILEKSDLFFINLELFNDSLVYHLDRLKMYNPDFKLLGLVNDENIKIILNIDLNYFEALIIKSVLIDEFKILFSLLNKNKKYYSPGIMKFINNNVEHLKYIDYERN